MPASQLHVDAATPLGATLVAGGATFSVWAPGALAVGVQLDGAPPTPDEALVKDDATGRWSGWLPGVRAGSAYRFLVEGVAGSGLKRDPWAREMGAGYPDCDCLVVDPANYPWHDATFQPPAADSLVVYQLHIGVWFAEDDEGNDLRPQRSARFLDAVERIPYLAELGVNAVQPLPVQEFQGVSSQGYNGTDLFSPERDYTVPTAELGPYLVRVNEHLAHFGQPALTHAQLVGQADQLKVFVDLCHLYGIAVLFDVVLNHAGGGLDAQSIDWFDNPGASSGDNLYFIGGPGLAGGLIFDFNKTGVANFLIGNAQMYLTEYHADGLRFDEVTVIDGNGGWFFCQQLTQALRQTHPAAILVAEYWGNEPWLAVQPVPAGMGFTHGYADTLRNGVRSVLQAAAAGAGAPVDMGQLAGALLPSGRLGQSWQAYNYIENHDLQLDDPGDANHNQPRIAHLGDWNDSRSWYARSRARVATAALLTGAGTPALFMGEELLEDQLWSDDRDLTADLVRWGGAEGKDSTAADFRAYTRDLISLRQHYAALRSGGIAVQLTDNDNRVVAFHRWVDGVGLDVVVVLSLNETTLYDYVVGLPREGHWREVFNGDYYDQLPNPQVKGNNGGVDAYGPPLHGLAQSATLTIAANGVHIFACDPVG